MLITGLFILAAILLLCYNKINHVIAWLVAVGFAFGLSLIPAFILTLFLGDPHWEKRGEVTMISWKTFRGDEGRPYANYHYKVDDAIIAGGDRIGQLKLQIDPNITQPVHSWWGFNPIPNQMTRLFGVTWIFGRIGFDDLKYVETRVPESLVKEFSPES